MRTYTTVIVDMFDTLVNFENRHLPQIQIDGSEIRSTSRYVYEVLRPLCGHVEFPEFARAFVGSYQDAEAIRCREQREVTAVERFRILLTRLHIPWRDCDAPLIRAGIEEHIRLVGRAIEFPESHRTTLEALHVRYRLGLLSNCDHTPLVETALAAHGIRGRFDAVVVSADVGWVKPRPEIFAEIFRRMDIGPAEAIFIGDTPELDILGAHRAGMDVIWIDHGTKPLPPDVPPPTHRVSSFPEIARLL